MSRSTPQPASGSLAARLTKWCVLALLTFLPFLIGWLTLEPVAITYLNGAVILTSLAAGATCLAGPRPLGRPPAGLLLAVTALFAGLAYALLATDPLADGFGLWANRLLQPALVGLVVFNLLDRKVLSPDALMQVMLAAFIPLSIYGVLQLAGIAPIQPGPRLNALYGSANDLARFVGTGLLVTFPWLMLRPGPAGRWGWPAWALGILLLVATQSYTGMAATAAGLVVVFAYLPTASQRSRRIGLGLVVVMALGLILFGRQLPAWQAKVATSLASRQEFWAVASGVIGDHPWTGIGIKTWEQTYPDLVARYGAQPPINWASPQPHNVYLDSLVKGGLPTLLGVLMFLIWGLVAGLCLVYHRPAPPWQWVGLSAVALGTALLTSGLVDDPLWTDDGMLVIFVVYCLLGWAQRQGAVARSTV